MVQDLTQVLRTELTGSTAGGNESGQSNLIHVLSHSCFRHTGSKSPENVAAIGGVKIPPGVPNETSPRCPTATAEHHVRPEPRRRVFAVRIDYKAGVRAKDRGCPFPYVTDHLPASERAVAGGESVHRNCPPMLAIEVRARRSGSLLAPGIPALGRREGASRAASVPLPRLPPIRLRWATVVPPSDSTHRPPTSTGE